MNDVLEDDTVANEIAEAPVNVAKATPIQSKAAQWHTVCREADIFPDTGVCVLVDGRQVAVFRLRSDGAVYAISNRDPFGEANVLSRGIVGSIGDRVVIASPLYKQHFDLQTGECLEDENYSVPSFPVRVVDGEVQVASVPG